MPEELEEILENDIPEAIDYVSLGKTLRKYRTMAGMNQAEGAKICKVSRTVYTKYEAGTVRPKKEDLREFAKKVKRGDGLYPEEQFQRGRIKKYFEENKLTMEKILIIENITRLNLFKYKNKLKHFS